MDHIYNFVDRIVDFILMSLNVLLVAFTQESKRRKTDTGTGLAGNKKIELSEIALK